MESIKEATPAVQKALEKLRITEADPSASPAKSQTLSCPECDDTGYVPTGKGLKRCKCRIEGIIRAHLPQRYHEARLADFSQQLAETVTSWLKRPTDGLLVIGGTGTGKTHLAAAITRFQIETSMAILFLRAADFFATIRATYSSSRLPDGMVRLTEGEVMDRYATVPMLILDDLGAGSLSEHERRCTHELLDMRLNTLLPTIVTTNWQLQEISERMDERIASRLQTFKLLEFTGQDWRGK